MKLALEKFLFIPLTVNQLDNRNGFNTIKPNYSEKTAIYEIPSSTAKIELMRFIGLTSLLSRFIDKHHVIMKPLKMKSYKCKISMKQIHTYSKSH